jgi:hypothetical protein
MTMTPGQTASASNISWERMIRAVERVRQRLIRATSALERAGIPYAVVGGNAVASWVSTVDEAAVRNTQDVDILIRRADLDAVKAALAPEGFIYQEVLGGDMFLDGPAAKPRDAVHVLFSGEILKPGDLASIPEVIESQPGGAGYQVVLLESLVRMKLTAFRDKDRTHIRDLIGVGLIDATWPARFPPELAARLQQILDTPEG